MGWSHGFQGSVYVKLDNPRYPADLSIDLTDAGMPDENGVGAFRFALSPAIDGYIARIVAESSDGEEVMLEQPIQGPRNARWFGFYAKDGASITNVRVVNISYPFYALGEFAVARVPEPVSAAVGLIVLVRPIRRRENLTV